MSQLASVHEYRLHDQVVRNGVPGVVTDARALHARVRWEDGTQEEVDQCDPTVSVETRAEEANHA